MSSTTNTPRPRATTPEIGSVGGELLSLYADMTVVYEHLVDAGEGYPAQLVQRAADAIERAHRSLAGKDGSAILRPWEAEPVDTWPT